MAPIVTKSGADDDIWANLLSSLQQRTNTRGNKTVIMLGTPQGGKTTLISKMNEQRDTHILSNPGVEFSYLTMRDEEREHIGRVGVYSTSYKEFLPHILTKERLPNTLVIITLSMDQPWNLDDELVYWTSLVEKHIQSLEVDDKEMEELQKKVADLFSSYQVPEKKGEGEEEEEKGVEEDKILLPVPEGALLTNLGVPILVVLSKVDCLTTLQKDNDFSEEHFEYIQWHFRKSCLAWGAGLLYCSPRENSNTKLLHDYISHLLYDMKFSTEAQVIDRDAIFVPIGWDSPEKIAVLSEGFVQFKQTKAYGDQIAVLPDVRQKRVMKGEEDQLFLTRMQAVLAEKQKSPAAQHKVLEGEAKGSTKTPPPTEGVLANFFNSLLQKKPGGSNSSTPAHSPSPPPVQPNLIPPKRALAPQLSGPQQREEHEKQGVTNTASLPEEAAAAPKTVEKSSVRTAEKSPVRTAEKSPVRNAGEIKPPASKLGAPSATRDKSPSKTTGVKKGIPGPAGTGVKKPVKRGLPQPRK